MSRTAVLTKTKAKTTTKNQNILLSDLNAPDNKGCVLRIVTYNVDGLRSELLNSSHRQCIHAMTQEILTHQPDVICLQEVTLESLRIFTDCLSVKYEPTCTYTTGLYFTMTFIANRYSLFSSHRIEFPSYTAHSSMGRDIHVTSFNFHGVDIAILNVHLESGAETSKVRLQQLRDVIHIVQDIGENPNTVKIACGDMNLRATEWKSIAKEYPEIVDLYEVSEAETKGVNVPSFTWQRTFPGKSTPFSSRFDRVLFRADETILVSNQSYKIIGMESIPTTIGEDWGYTRASDHLGIFASLYFPGATDRVLHVPDAASDDTLCDKDVSSSATNCGIIDLTSPHKDERIDASDLALAIQMSLVQQQKEQQPAVTGTKRKLSEREDN